MSIHTVTNPLTGETIQADPSTPLHRNGNGQKPSSQPKIEQIKANILAALDAINDDPNTVFELSVLRNWRGRDILDKGYFDDRQALATEAARRTLKTPATAIYVNLQPIDPQCLHRACNKMLDGCKPMTAADVTGYRNFLVDIDRAGIKGISATNEEKAEIFDALRAMREFLVHELGWPDPSFSADSGNGGHENWRIDLPKTKENQDLLKRCCLALNQKFGSSTLSIDASLADPNQLIKLYGTMTRKGDDTPERPHRFSEVLDSYETETVTLEQLQSLADLYIGNDNSKQQKPSGLYWKAGTPEAVEKWAESHSITLGDRESDSHPLTGSGHKWKVDCLTSDAHKDGAAIFLNGKGNLKYRCHHASCADKTEADVLAKYPAGQARNSNQTNTTVDEVIAVLAAIGADPNTDTDAKMKRLVNEVSGLVAQLDQVYHLNVELALVQHLALSQTKAEKFTATCRKQAKQIAQQAKIEAQQEKQSHIGANRPTIQANARQLSAIVAESLQALVQGNASNPQNPTLYIRGGALTRIITDENGAPGAQVLSQAALLHRLGETADWVAVATDQYGNEKTVETFPPQPVVSAVGAMGMWPGLPALEGIVNAPTFAPDGTLHDQYGYNPTTRLFNASTLTLGDTDPTTQNVEAAKQLILDDLLYDFPFKDDASRAHAVALLILPFVRPMINGPTPLHLTDSPTPGTGKGLQISACTLPAIGRDVHSMAPGKDEDEWRKRLTSTLLLGGTHISIDNIREPLDSGVLASVLTQEYIEDRVLGSSQTVRLRVRTIWCANGNNVTPSEEIARRSIWIRLDANSEKPWDRQGFKHENLRGWLLQNRAQIVTAVVTLVRKWIADGMPAYRGKNKGSYDAWTQVIGGILQAVEIPGFLGNENELFATTVSDTEILREFVEAWWKNYRDLPVLSADLFKLASHPDEQPKSDDALVVTQMEAEWHGLLDSVLGSGKQQSRKTKMGNLLGGYKDKVFGSFKIEKATPSAGSPRWRLVNVGEPSNQGSPNSPPLPTPVSDDYAKVFGDPVDPYSMDQNVREEKFFVHEKECKKNNTSVQPNGAKGSPRVTSTRVEGSPEGHQNDHPTAESKVVTWTL